MIRFPLLLACLLICPAAPCAAEVQVSLPLNGYYRAGKFMPVRVVVRGEAPQEITLSADGAVTTVVPMGPGAADVIVPLQVVREPPGQIAWTLADGRAGSVAGQLIALGERDRLVGIAGGDSGATADVFPGMTILPVALDPADPLRGPAVAWEALDAAVVDRVRREFIWQRRGGAWVAAVEPIGPTGAIMPEAYLPTSGWKPGRHPAERRQLVLVAVLIGIGVVASTLWRSRLSLAALAGVCLLSCAALAFRSARLTPVAVARGVVDVRQDGVVHSDEWEFYRAMDAATAAYRPKPMGRPVFASVRHFERSGVRLRCDRDGRPRVYTFPLTPETALVFLTRRTWIPSSALAPDASATSSPLWPLVREGYLRPGVRAAGEIPGELGEGPPARQEVWPGVVLDASAR